MNIERFTFNCLNGPVTVELRIYKTSNVEAIDVYEQSPAFDWTYRIEGTVQNEPVGWLWFHAGLCDYHGEAGDAERVARRFLAGYANRSLLEVVQ